MIKKESKGPDSNQKEPKDTKMKQNEQKRTKRNQKKPKETKRNQKERKRNLKEPKRIQKEPNRTKSYQLLFPSDAVKFYKSVQSETEIQELIYYHRKCGSSGLCREKTTNRSCQ